MIEGIPPLWSTFPWMKGQQLGSLAHAAEAPSLPTLTPEAVQFLSQVRVELRVEVGSVELSLEQLLDLSPGRKLALELPETLPIALTLEGKTTARGMLVAVEDELFIEITSLPAKDS